MENKKPTINETMREQLRKPLPPEAISQHPTKTYLSTIKAIYVVERLNDVFGVGRWNLRTEVVKGTENYVLMKGKLTILDYDCEIPVQYGGHATAGKGTELADGYKSAATDCLSKCASYLEVGIDVFKGKVKSAPVKTVPVQDKSEIEKGESVPLCSICGKPMRKSKAGRWYCRHKDEESGQIVWGDPVYETKHTPEEEKFLEELDKKI